MDTQICVAFGLEQNAKISLLQDGENTTYLAADGERRLVIRKYRHGRFTRSDIEAELSWLEALRPGVPVIEVIRTADGQRCYEFQGRYYAAFPFLDASSVEMPGAGDYLRLGRLMRALHDAADRALQEQPADWPGRKRPTYDEEILVADPCRRLLQSEHVAAVDRPRILAIAERLSGEFTSLRPAFVHNDLHFGNIMQSHGRDVIIDFDECGFGPRGLDFGVVRLHMRARGHIDEMWPVFEEGYGRPIPRTEATVGTALRVFWMAGKILLRPDVVRDPHVRVPRYLGWIEAELAGPTEP